MRAKLIVSALALAATAIASNAYATQINVSGASFHAYNAEDATSIDYLPEGVRSYLGVSTAVIATIPHIPSGITRTIYIDGFHYGYQVTECTVTSHDYDGTLMASKSVVKAAIGSWEMGVSMPHNETGIWTYLSVLCHIPGNTNGTVLGIIIV